MIQIFFVFYAIFSIFSYTGYQQKFVPIFCLLAVLGLEKLQTRGSASSDSKENNRGRKLKKQQAEKDSKTGHINNLLKSQNPIIVADAVQYLFHDLGLFVSRAPKSKVISRLVQGSVEDIPVGVVIIRDISKINAAWKEWDAIAEYGVRQGKGYRTLFIWSNCFETKGGEMRPRNFPDVVKKILVRKNVVAMGTDTFHALYDLCSSGKIEIRGVLEKIRNHSGGVITLKR